MASRKLKLHMWIIPNYVDIDLIISTLIVMVFLYI